VQFCIACTPDRVGSQHLPEAIVDEKHLVGLGVGYIHDFGKRAQDRLDLTGMDGGRLLGHGTQFRLVSELVAGVLERCFDPRGLNRTRAESLR